MSCRALDDVVPRDRACGAGRATSSSRSAPDRSAPCRSPDRAWSLRAPGSSAVRTVMSAVAAPADRRFRRAHVKPARRRRSWRAMASAGADRDRPRRRRSSYGAYRDVGDRRARARAGGRAHHGPRQRAAVERRSARGAERPARRKPASGPTSTPGAGGCWRRRGCATPRCGGRCRRRSKSWCPSGSRSASAASTADMYLVDERGVIIDQYGPQYADLDLPIIDGLSAAAGARRLADRRRARGSRGAGDRRGRRRSRASRGGCRRSTSPTCTTRR